MCEESDIKEMGIPMGPRKKIRGYLKLQKHRQVYNHNHSLPINTYFDMFIKDRLQMFINIFNKVIM